MRQVGYISIMNNNFGDALNEPILRALTSNEIDFIHYNRITSQNQRISAIGSIAFLWTGNAVVWGSGVLSETSTCPKNLKDMTFRCVRGPKTRTNLIERGYEDIPEIYCDPGVLAPYFYQNVISETKDFDIGIFPHNTENVEWLLNNIRSHDYRKVMVINYTDQIDRVVYNMSRCKRIISSSLHGIVVAEALNIPVSWYILTDANDPFKFYDYFEGTRRYDVKCNDFRGYHPTSVNFSKLEVLPKATFDIKGLLDSFPYNINEDLKKDILRFYDK